MTVIEIRSGDRRATCQGGLNGYGSRTPYVSPMWDFDRNLDATRNPLVTAGHGRFEVFAALKDDRSVGRIVATMHDASNKRHGTARGHSASSTAKTTRTWPARADDG